MTGLSGSGKSTALKIIEDQGYFPIDNLPVVLLPSLVTLLKKTAKHFPKIVLGMDARDANFLTSCDQVMTTLLATGVQPEILFFESSDEILVRRFSESRRPHPLRKKGSLLHAIAEEKQRLLPLRELATKVFDTSKLTVHSLKKHLHHYLNPSKAGEPLAVHLLSFGYKYGIPTEADLLFDVRFLTNPYFVPRLKDLDGTTQRVKKFVLKQKDAKVFIQKVLEFLKFLLPRYQKEGKAHLTVAFGCTGGKHRSVVLAEALKRKLQNKKWKLFPIHRDIEKIT